MRDNNWFAQLNLGNLKNWQPVSGGDINEAYQLQTADKRYFIKVQPQHPASYFDHEKRGLEELSQVINTPVPVTSGEIDGDAYLILNWLDSGHGSQSDLGHAVAKMHLHHHDQFGFYTSHHTKALFKDNSFNRSWTDFYVKQRLMSERDAAQAAGRWNDFRENHFQRMVQAFQKCYAKSSVQPSLLHGDLWAGNYMFTPDGSPTLIDPDALYGDREYDLAMTTIFSGFSPEFYQAYNETYPLDPGFEDRLPWYQFYYLCMHLILFGEMYGGSVDNILEKYWYKKDDLNNEVIFLSIYYLLNSAL